MKKTIIALCITCCLTLAVRADDEKSEQGKKHKATPEQKAVQKQIKEKYDTNKDGKLDAEERAKISDEDKAKLKAARGKSAEADKKDKHDATDKHDHPAKPADKK